LENSWELVKASVNVLKADKGLLVFPLLSAVASIVVLLSFAVAIFATPLQEAMFNSPDGRFLSGIVMFSFYLLQYFVIIFANAGLVSAALIRLRGGNPTIGDGFRVATSHIGSLFVYAIISATFGIVLRMLAERLGFIGRIIVSLIGAAWGVATFLVVPVIVSEPIGPVDAISRSMGLLKKTWGEQVVANAGIGIIFGWLFVLSIFLFMGGVYMSSEVFHSPMGLLPVGGIFITWILGLSLLRATLNGIYSAALYRFATEGDAGSDFSPQLIQSAFRPKQLNS
jgi:hypothetical protein